MSLHKVWQKKINDYATIESANELIENVFKNDTLNAIDSPMNLVSFDLPNIGGLEAQKILIGLNFLDLKVDHIKDIAVFQVLENATSKQDIHNRLETNHLFLKMQFFLNSKSSSISRILRILTNDDDETINNNTNGHRSLMKPGDNNIVDFSISLDSINVLLDILAKISNYSILSTQIGQILSTDCWVAKLEPYGGVNKFKFELNQFLMNLRCGNSTGGCDSALIEEFIEKLNQPEAQAQLHGFLNNLIDNIFSSLSKNYDIENWNQTIMEAEQACKTATHNGDYKQDEIYIGEIKSNDTDAYILIAGLATIFLILGVALCIPTMKHR
jgi:hypothetical protein